MEKALVDYTHVCELQEKLVWVLLQKLQKGYLGVGTYDTAFV